MIRQVTLSSIPLEDEPSQLETRRRPTTTRASVVNSVAEADAIFDAVDVDQSGYIDLPEFLNYLEGYYRRDVITALFEKTDTDQNGLICRNEFRRALLSTTTSPSSTSMDADLIFDLVDLDGSGGIDLHELQQHLQKEGYCEREITKLHQQMDLDQNGQVSRSEFRQALSNTTKTTNGNTVAPQGYFLNSVQQAYVKLGPIGRLSQKVETMGPFKRFYNGISNLCGIDTKQISKLGVSFALSYSIISNINGALSLSVAWYISCKRTGLSPLVPGQWKSLLAAYATIYGLIQILRPFRVAAAIGMSKLSAEYLEMTQRKFQCSKTVAIMLQYLSGWLMMGTCAGVGVTCATALSGVPLWTG